MMKVCENFPSLPNRNDEFCVRDFWQCDCLSKNCSKTNDSAFVIVVAAVAAGDVAAWHLKVAVADVKEDRLNLKGYY